MSFKKAALNAPVEARTLNGMKALASSLNKNVDLFTKIGASRGKDISAEFEAAYQEDSDLALRIALWARDVRGGSGERQLFRDILLHLEKYHLEVLTDTFLLQKIPELGRWDDLLVFTNKDVKSMAYNLIKKAINDATEAQSILSRLESMSDVEAQRLLDTYQNEIAS